MTAVEAPIIPHDNVSSTTCGSIIYPPGGSFGPRLQADAQLVLLHTGNMTVTIDGHSHQVRPGNVILLWPGRTESFKFAVDQTTWHRWIAVNLVAAGVPCDNANASGELPFSMPITEELNRLTELLLQLRNQYEPDSAVMRSFGHSALQLYASIHRSSHGPLVHPSVLTAKEWIHDNYQLDVSLEYVARAAGVSAEHLVRLFRAGEGTTPIRYLWHYRVLRAVELLIHTGLSVSEIAYRCGFKTSYHFARTIKKQTGLSATDIRVSSWNHSK